MAKKKEAQYVRIQRSIWNKRRFRSVSEDAQKLYLYIAICPHGNMTGLFTLRPGYAVEDLQWETEPERFTKGLGELLAARLVNYDYENKIVFDYAQLSKFPPQNQNQVTGAISKLEELPLTPLFQDLLTEVKGLGKPLVKPLVKWLGNRLGNNETEAVDETEDETEGGINTPTSSLGEKASPDDDCKCPHEKIIDLYHEVLPMLPRVHVWPENNRKILRTRWKEEPERQNLAWWRSYFEYVRESQFLTGKEKDWTANLEWIVRPANMTKVLNGSYHKQKHGGIREWLNEMQGNSPQ
ncbi:MAG: hypothetical protein JW724_03180 [Candidatus Altiarchaeota archaeon]|nr:hypothetical protein [Candidatus Altiarchaeota archaeon]